MRTKEKNILFRRYFAKLIFDSWINIIALITLFFKQTQGDTGLSYIVLFICWLIVCGFICLTINRIKKLDGAEA